MCLDRRRFAFLILTQGKGFASFVWIIFFTPWQSCLISNNTHSLRTSLVQDFTCFFFQLMMTCNSSTMQSTFQHCEVGSGHKVCRWVPAWFLCSLWLSSVMSSAAGSYLQVLGSSTRIGNILSRLALSMSNSSNTSRESARTRLIQGWTHNSKLNRGKRRREVSIRFTWYGIPCGLLYTMLFLSLKLMRMALTWLTCNLGM